MADFQFNGVSPTSVHFNGVELTRVYIYDNNEFLPDEVTPNPNYQTYVIVYDVT